MTVVPRDHIDYFDLNYNASSLIFNNGDKGIMTSSGFDWKAIAAKVAIYIFPIIFTVIAFEVIANCARLLANFGILAANHAITLWKGPAEQPQQGEPASPFSVASSESQPGATENHNAARTSTPEKTGRVATAFHRAKTSLSGALGGLWGRITENAESGTAQPVEFNP